MNGIGIDLGPTAAKICLCERKAGASGWAGRNSWRAIGDGRRSHIPAACDEEGRWASEAIEGQADSLQSGSLASNEGGWPAGVDSNRFLTGMGQRIASYLGRYQPRRRHGFEVVFAPQALEYIAATSLIQNTCRGAAAESFGDAVCIPPMRALLCRWAAERMTADDQTVRALVIHIGDMQTTATTYEVAFDGASPLLVRSLAPRALPGVGSFRWERALVEVIADRNRKKLTPLLAEDILDALRQMAERMRRSDRRGMLELPHRLTEGMYQKLNVTCGDMARTMPAVLELTMPLPPLVEELLHQESVSDTTEVILGGAGASWPFGLDALLDLCTRRGISLWQSSDPREDVARGAALWPLWAGNSATGGDWRDEGDLIEPGTRTASLPAESVSTRKSSLFFSDLPEPIRLPPSEQAPVAATVPRPTSGDAALKLGDWMRQPPAHPPP